MKGLKVASIILGAVGSVMMIVGSVIDILTKRKQMQIIGTTMADRIIEKDGTVVIVTTEATKKLENAEK